jgi:hypothetical protein
MDGAMMGLAGTVVGASAVGMAGIVRSMAETWFPGVAAKTDHKHQMSINLQSQRTGEAAQLRTAHEVHCDNPTLMLLSLEIGRIEKDWIDEASGRPRRTRRLRGSP